MEDKARIQDKNILSNGATQVSVHPPRCLCSKPGLWRRRRREHLPSRATTMPPMCSLKCPSLRQRRERSGDVRRPPWRTGCRPIAAGGGSVDGSSGGRGCSSRVSARPRAGVICFLPTRAMARVCSMPKPLALSLPDHYRALVGRVLPLRLPSGDPHVVRVPAAGVPRLGVHVFPADRLRGALRNRFAALRRGHRSRLPGPAAVPPRTTPAEIDAPRRHLRRGGQHGGRITAPTPVALTAVSSPRLVMVVLPFLL